MGSGGRGGLGWGELGRQSLVSAPVTRAAPSKWSGCCIPLLATVGIVLGIVGLAMMSGMMGRGQSA